LATFAVLYLHSVVYCPVITLDKVYQAATVVAYTTLNVAAVSFQWATVSKLP